MNTLYAQETDEMFSYMQPREALLGIQLFLVFPAHITVQWLRMGNFNDV